MAKKALGIGGRDGLEGLADGSRQVRGRLELKIADAVKGHPVVAAVGDQLEARSQPAVGVRRDADVIDSDRGAPPCEL